MLVTNPWHMAQWGEEALALCLWCKSNQIFTQLPACSHATHYRRYTIHGLLSHSVECTPSETFVAQLVMTFSFFYGAWSPLQFNIGVFQHSKPFYFKSKLPLCFGSSLCSRLQVKIPILIGPTRKSNFQSLVLLPKRSCLGLEYWTMEHAQKQQYCMKRTKVTILHS